MGAVLYSGPSFSGLSQELPSGRYDVGQLTVGNDAISSLRVPPGWSVTLYSESGFLGDSITFASDAAFVGDAFAGRISSVVVEMAVGVIVFDDSNFQGRFQMLPPGRHEVGALTVGNDTIGSLRVPPGWRVTLYSESGFWGDSITFTSDSASVGASLNRRTSSVIVEVMTGVVVFENRDFAGRFQILRPGRHDVGQFTIGNDTISSLLVPAGWSATLYSESGFWGDSKSFLANTDFVGEHLDNRTSSIIIEGPPIAGALSPETLYWQFEQFFLQKFGHGERAGAPMFRFAQIPQNLVDSDFLDAQHPEWGPLPTLAAERLSGWVDMLPLLDPNGRGVWMGLTPHALCGLYRDEILGPAVPYLPPGADANEKQRLIETFGQIKRDAEKKWEHNRASSLLGRGTLCLSSVTPTDCWKRTAPGVWTPCDFPVDGGVATIRFDYCLVTISRPWLHTAFINDASWCISGMPQGHLSARNLAALPVGFVAIKNLRIQAPWTPADIANLEQSPAFGPFNFDGRVVNGSISYEGIQIIGWLLEKQPDLPPKAGA